MIRFMIGEVKEVTEDHTITFNLSDWAEEIGSPPPSATPLTKLTRFPQEGDEVFILQPDSKFEIFFYTLTPDDNFDISLNYGPAYIKIYNSGDAENPEYHIEGDSQGSTFKFEKNKAEIKVSTDSAKSTYSQIDNKVMVDVNGMTSITFDSSSSGNVNIVSGESKIEMTNTDVTVNGHLKVTV